MAVSADGHPDDRNRFGSLPLEIPGVAPADLVRGSIAGILSATAYWIVIWAMSEAQMGLVAALRESSVVFAALLGAIFLNERVRWLGVAFVFAGVALVRLA